MGVTQEWKDVPANADGECSLGEVTAFDDWGLAVDVRAGAIKDLMTVAVVCCGLVGMGMRVVVGMRHVCDWGIEDEVWRER